MHGIASEVTGFGWDERGTMKCQAAHRRTSGPSRVNLDRIWLPAGRPNPSVFALQKTDNSVGVAFESLVSAATRQAPVCLAKCLKVIQLLASHLVDDVTVAA